MSEEILKALMQLFALIVKQDSGVAESERRYVIGFLSAQLSDEDAGSYLALFDEQSGIINGQIPPKQFISTSVIDSVRILNICKKINRTLTQQQKVVVLVRLYELLNTEKKFTEQRMNIINTVAEVFRFTREEFSDIEMFVKVDHPRNLNSPNVLIFSGYDLECQNCRVIHAISLAGYMVILRISSVDLYFLRVFNNPDVTLNGFPVHEQRISLLANGSVIRIPKGKPVYYSDIVSHFLADTTSLQISYSAEKIGYRFPGGDYALHNISFSEKQGRLIGILGSSGTGKTTLLNILSGIEKPSQGKIRINGKDLHAEKDSLRGIIGYIPQDDLLIEELTVFENLYFNAKLCSGEKSDKEITRLVDQTLNNLGLTDTKHLRVGSLMNKIISGGQRKRLNIALELIREPSIMFVDEPTSGLSSRDSENVMDLLRELTLKGKLIFVVIHQPSSVLFKMFDHVLILDNGGYMSFHGNPIEAVIYFKTQDAQINRDIGECPVCGNVNPELIFNIMEAQVVDEFGRYTGRRKVPPEKWEEKFTKSFSPEKVEEVTGLPPVSMKIPGRIRQFLIYLRRDFRSKKANTQYVALTLLEAPLLGLILSYLIRYIADPNSQEYIFRENENIPIYIFMSMIVALFIGLTISAEEIFRDRKLLRREALLNLSRNSYLFSKVTLLLGLSAFQALVFVFIGNSILGIREMYFEYWLAFFTTAAFANLLGLNISASFNSAITIYILIPLLIIPMMVLSGAMFSFDKLNRKLINVGKVPVIAELMATRWTYEALMVHQFTQNRYQKLLYDAEKDESNAYFKTVEYLPYLHLTLDKAIELSNQPGKTHEIAGKLMLLKNELGLEMERVPGIAFQGLGKLDPHSFSADIALAARKILNELVKYYSELGRDATFRKEKMMEFYDNHNPDLFRSMRKDYHNESVADIVKDIYERYRILEYRSRLIRQFEPVFFDPEPTGLLDIRSHFYSPRKHFLGRYFNTFQFNISIVWIMTLLLYATLYFNILKHLTGLFGQAAWKKIKYAFLLGFIKKIP